MDIIERIIDFVYPPRCYVCDELFGYFDKERYVCQKCIENIHKMNTDDRCPKCSKELDESKCSFCAENETIINISYLSYRGTMQKLIYNMKYGNNKEVSDAIVKLNQDFIEEDIKKFELIDYIVPVPMHNQRLYTRGFNQTELISKKVGKIIDKPVKNFLVRHKITIFQSKLTYKGRKNNTKNAFSINKIKESTDLIDKNILIIDDVYTSGSTVNECAKVLYKAGAKSVISFCTAVTESEKVRKK